MLPEARSVFIKASNFQRGITSQSVWEHHAKFLANFRMIRSFIQRRERCDIILWEKVGKITPFSCSFRSLPTYWDSF